MKTKMQTIVNSLRQGRVTRWIFLGGLLIAVGATVAGMNQRQYQLGGGFIGTSPGSVWNAVQAPLDPAGRTAALRVKSVAYDESLAGLLNAFGADTLTEGVGENQMISRDTAKLAMVAYAQAGGKAPGEPLRIMALFVYAGTMQFTDSGNVVLNYTITVYPASADANQDGFPDEGATPALTIPGVTGAGKRVPVQ